MCQSFFLLITQPNSVHWPIKHISECYMLTCTVVTPIYVQKKRHINQQFFPHTHTRTHTVTILYDLALLSIEWLTSSVWWLQVQKNLELMHMSWVCYWLTAHQQLTLSVCRCSAQMIKGSFRHAGFPFTQNTHHLIWEWLLSFVQVVCPLLIFSLYQNII